VDPVPDPLLLRISESSGNQTQDLWISRQKFWPLIFSLYDAYKSSRDVVALPLLVSSLLRTKYYLIPFETSRWF
jgi:hypothetical protein